MVKRHDRRADGKGMLASRLRSEDRGFTLVEVVVAIFILLVGVLGVVSLIDGANFATAKTKSREGGTNLARELLDGARAVDYDKLNPAEIVGELQKQPGLADSDSSASGWQISRRGINYTVAAVPVCKVDDAADGFGDQSEGGFCSTPSPAPSGDGNPDDLRRMDVTIRWSVGAVTSSVRQTTLIINPSGSLGPSVKTFCVTAASLTTTCPATPISVVQDAARTKVSFAATTSAAAAFRWQVDDAASRGDGRATPSESSTSWTFDWDLGTVGSFECNVTPNWTLDGNYLVSAQAFDAFGIQGQRTALTLTVNRSEPFETCEFAGGYNDPPDKSAVVELQWKANPERDIVGYRVYRQEEGSPSAVEVCDTIKTSCSDLAPPTTGRHHYFAVSLDRDPATGGPREGGQSSNLVSIELPAEIETPPAPGGVHASTVDGLPAITWDASTAAGVRFYRIYRDGTEYAHRYDQTGDGLTTTWTDTNPGAGGHTYYVSAVATSGFAESEAIAAVKP
jgi:prepilin-type N-terminal cleavage/methylation domain-containing protein